MTPILSTFDTRAIAVCHALSEAFKVATLPIKNTTGSTLTFGLEIECPWSSYFPGLWEKYNLKKRSISMLEPTELVALTEECSALEKKLLPFLQLTTQCGVPRGNDRYWEFATHPVHNINILIEQVRLLTECGALPRDKKHSLQVTIGNMAPNPSLYYLLMLLEVFHVTPGRLSTGIEQTRKTIHTGWARKGLSGVHLKTKDDLEDCSTAVELRTLQLPVSHYETEKILRLTAWAAQAIHALQLNGKSPQTEHWVQLENVAKQSLTKVGLPVCNWGRLVESEKYDVWSEFERQMPCIRTELEPFYAEVCDNIA